MKPHRIFFFLTLILLPTQLGLHVWPEWSMVLGRRIDYLAPTIYLTDVTIFLTLISWGISAKIYNLQFSIFNKFSIKQNLKKQIKRKIFFISLSLCLFIFLNILFAASPLVAFCKWLKVFEFGLFGVYIIKTKPSFFLSLVCLSFAVLYSSLIAIAQFFLQHSMGGILWFLGERTFTIDTPGIARILVPSSIISHEPREFLRPYATFPHPNVLGGFLAVTLPLLIIQLSNHPTLKLSNRKSYVLKAFNIISLILGFIAIVLTFSRSAWIAGSVGLLLVLVYQKKKLLDYCPPARSAGPVSPGSIRGGSRQAGKAGVIGLLVIIGLFACALPYFQTLTSESESVAVRNELNTAAVKMFFSSPVHVVFGVGLGNFLVNLPYISSDRQIFFLQPVHNIYLLFLSETGIVGTSLFFYLFWIMLKKLSRGQLSVPLLVSLSLYLCLGLVDHYPLTLQQGQLLLTLLISFSFTFKKSWS